MLEERTTDAVLAGVNNWPLQAVETMKLTESRIKAIGTPGVSAHIGLPRMFPQALHSALLEAGYSVHSGTEAPNNGYWWVLRLPGWTECEVAPDLFDDAWEAWVDAAVHCVREVTNNRKAEGG